jgi:hypothetical protein
MTIVRDEIVSQVRQRVIRNRILKRLGLVPHAGQQRVLDAIDRGCKRIGVNAGTRGGKSVITQAPILTQGTFGPDGKQPLRVIPIIAPYAELTDKVFRMVSKAIMRDNIYRTFIPDFNPRRQVKYSERERYIEMPWEARIIGSTADNPASILGEGWPFVLCDEFARFKPGVFEEYVERGLTDVNGCALLITTPHGMNHWHDIFMDWTRQAAMDPTYYTTCWTSYENPYVSHEAIDKIREEYERRGLMDVFRMNFLAEFTALQGAIYGMFRPSRGSDPWHVGDVEFEPELPVYLGIDWGENFRCLFGQVAEWDCLNVIDEIAIVENAPNRQLDAVMQKLEHYAKLAGIDQPGELIQMAYCDPSGKQMKTHFQRAGISVFWTSPEEKRTINDVEDGITAVQWRFSEPDRPMLRIDRSRCPDLIERVPAYERNSVTTSPIKLNDHSVDALRYLVVGCFGLVAEPARMFF